MAYARFKLALGAAMCAAGALATAAALAQAPAAAAPPAPQYPPTATITTPGYPALGPADSKLRVTGLPNGKKVHLLPATLETTQWGWFDNAQPPVLRVQSGDTVVLETMMHSHNQVVPGTTIEQIKKLRTDFPGRGPHTLTGPIYIEGAEPGDVLKVTLNKIVPRAYATNFNVPGMFGQFPNIYPDGQVKYLYLDIDKMTTEFLPGVVLPLSPFPGTIGVARKEPGRYSSVPPGEYAGNMDIRDFIEGSIALRAGACRRRAAVDRRLPRRPGQRRGEPHRASRPPTRSSTSRWRCSRDSRSTFRASRRPSSWITMGFDQDLNKAWDQVRAQTLKFLAEQRSISPEQAEHFDDDGLRLPCVAGGQRQEGHPLPQPEGRDRQRGHGAADRGDAVYLVTHVQDADLNKAMDEASMG